MDCANSADNVGYTEFAKFRLFLDLYKQTINYVTTCIIHMQASLGLANPQSKNKSAHRSSM